MKTFGDSLYVLIGEEIRGPMSLVEVQRDLREGWIPETALFAREGDDQWRPAEFFPSQPLERKLPRHSESVVLDRFFAIVVLSVLGFLGLVIILSMIDDPRGRADGLRFFAVVSGIIVYFVPTYLARRKKHRNFTAIAALNILGGWTFLGWLAALVWVLYKPPGDPVQNTPEKLPSALPEPPSGSSAVETRRVAGF